MDATKASIRSGASKDGSPAPFSRRNFLSILAAGAVGAAGALVIAPPSLKGEKKAGEKESAQDGANHSPAYEKLTAPGGQPKYYTLANPGKWAHKAALHVPKVSVDGKTMTVWVDHVQEIQGAQGDHIIFKAWLEDMDGNVLAEHHFPIVTKETPQDAPCLATFPRPEGHDKVRVMFECNKHGIWMTIHDFNVSEF